MQLLNLWISILDSRYSYFWDWLKCTCVKFDLLLKISCVFCVLLIIRGGPASTYIYIDILMSSCGKSSPLTQTSMYVFTCTSVACNYMYLGQKNYREFGLHP